MSKKRAQELQPQVAKQLDKVLAKPNGLTRKDVFLYVGKKYLETLTGSSLFTSTAIVKIANGTPGKRLTDLYHWLYGEMPVQPSKPHKQITNTVSFRGIKVGFSKEETINLIRVRLSKEMESSNAIYSWYVLERFSIQCRT